MGDSYENSQRRPEALIHKHEGMQGCCSVRVRSNGGAEEKDPGFSITHVEDDREKQAKGKTLEDPRSGRGLASRIVNVQSFADNFCLG